ncbi:amidase family protein [Polaromonas sp. C04]|uniref:amidase family protein n=1 Tax=Polaromonas sp. C04 TaxID=1945857 RepID=UPI0009863A49|nr:amidase family protein [Polaromonas sp. C04]OOG49965.1 amidase [Polaromonas sp. C04]
MTQPLWRWSATNLAEAIRNKRFSVREATQSVLARIAEVNPRVNALAEVLAEEALDAADAADRALARGDTLGPLHGVPVTIKVNIDTAGHATTDGVVAARDNLATTDSPLVTHLRHAGAVIVGRSNTPAFSLRWFTDNELHGRTLNPFDAKATPGGSSGGAAAAVATGMGSIAHGNDYGGSIRYPAWACGVVGLRTTVGRVTSYKASAPNRIISNQQMSVQGPLTRTVADARLALQVMAQGSPLDPQWTPAPLEYPDTHRPLKVALFKRHAAYDADPTVVAAVEQAAGWLAAAGCEVEEVEPPHFEEGARLWRHLVMEDMRRGGQPAIEAMADAGTKAALRGYMKGLPVWDRDAYLDALTRRFNICRDWAVFLEQYPVLLMPNSWQRQFPVDADRVSAQRVHELIAAQSPLLGTAMMGLPGLAVPTGLVDGLPIGVQLVSSRFREDLALRAGEIIERAAGFSALDHLAA